jgi:hypothetical protein
MESKQISVVFGVLAFLGTFAVLAAATAALIGTKLIGEERLARCFTIGAKWLFGGWGLARKITIVALAVAVLYSTTLLGASIASQEWTLAPGAEKYFCEVDCHLAYSVTSVEVASMVGAGPSAVKAQGNFLIISVLTRFDILTTSRHRGDSPLVPNEREITIVDDAGRSYAISETAQNTLKAQGLSGASMTQPLRPAESFISKLVFDLPADYRNPRLLIQSPSNPHWIGAILIGDEESVLHKKVFLALPAISVR